MTIRFSMFVFAALLAPKAIAQEPLGLRLSAPQHLASASTLVPKREPPDRILVESEVELRPDGSLVGRAVTTASGPSGILLRRFVKPLLEMPLGAASERIMAQQMLSGVLTALNAQSEGEAVAIGTTFLLHPIAHRDGARVALLQPAPRFVRPAYVNIVTHLREKIPGPVMCPFQSVQQRSRIRLPEGYPDLVLPPDVSIQLGTTSYHARYRREGDMLNLERSLLIDAGHSVCSVDKLKEIAPVIHAAAHDFNRRLALP
jgi:hypothetical protein